MMIDVASLCEVLNAEYERMEFPESKDLVHAFRFHDSVMRYELHLYYPTGTVLLAIDPEKPIQPCPLLEYTFRGVEIEIGENAYDPTAGPAIRFWEGDRQHDNLRLTLMPLANNRWYLWANA